MTVQKPEIKQKSPWINNGELSPICLLILQLKLSNNSSWVTNAKLLQTKPITQANKSSSSLSSSDSGDLSLVNLLMRLKLSWSNLMWLSLGVSKMSRSWEDLLSSLSVGRNFTPCLIILKMLSIGFTVNSEKNRLQILWLNYYVLHKVDLFYTCVHGFYKNTVKLV